MLFSISVLLAFCIAEAAIRIFLPDIKAIPQAPTQWVNVPEQAWTERHPVLGWYHQKNKQASLKLGEFQIAVNTNSQGFRGMREYEYKKPQGIVRALTLGDSFAFGWGVQDSETFSAQLEARYQNLEALNLGVAAYGVDQLLLALRTLGKPFHPDYVLITLFPEDFWRATRAFTNAGYGKPYFQLVRGGELILKNVPVQEPAKMNFYQFPEVVIYGPVTRTLMYSALCRYFKNKALRLARDLGWIDPDLTVDWQLGEAILKVLVREIREIGARPIVVVVPPLQWMGNTKPTSIQKSLMRFSKREGVDIIDLTSFFIKARAEFGIDVLYIKQDGHWTAEGHLLAARVVGEHLDGLTTHLRRRAH